MSTDEARPVDLSAVASHETDPLHADAGADFGLIDESLEDELADDDEDVPFDLGADVAHPHLPHQGGAGFDLTRDVSL